MGRSSGLGNMIGSVTDGKPLRGSGGSGIPMPMMPTENIGMISGAIRKKGGGRRDERGSKRGGSMTQVTMRDPESGRMYGGLVKDGQPQFKKPDFVSDENFNKSFPMRSKPSKEELINDPQTRREVKATRRRLEDQPGFDRRPVSRRRPPDVGPFPDPTLGGPPEREVPIPKERPIRIEDGQKNFFETMFERADNKRQMRDIEKGERRDRQEAMREEARMRDSERGGGRKKEDRGGRRMRDDDRGGRNKRRRRRDFTRKRSRMEGRRSREERGAFRDKYVSTLRR